jgi:DNA-binding transcriptional ArsR family regulator
LLTTSKRAEIANLAGHPAHACILNALMDERALTAAELAAAASVTAQTASGHLGRLTAAGLLSVEKQGRRRYYRLASPLVARMIESIMHTAAALGASNKPVRTGPRDQALRLARTCYNHLAGRLGVAINDAVIEAGHADIEGDAGAMTADGLDRLADHGIQIPPVRGAGRRRRVFCRPCLDWSERRPHLAGTVGAAICSHALARQWVRRRAGSRALIITPHGHAELRRAFGIDLALGR